ncbi:hypothetical protein GF362_06970 [Candidatus Dojkabacteria bacterium]|nr:hypothetical protein [Candidatus Dojkabacteria bacterium]
MKTEIFDLKLLIPTYYISLTVYKRLDIFTKAEYLDLIAENLKFYSCKHGVKIYGYVLLTNQLFCICSTTKLLQFSYDFKGYTTKAILDLLELDERYYLLNFLEQNKIRIWERTTCIEVITNINQLKEKLNHLSVKPVNAGFVKEPCHWKYSY